MNVRRVASLLAVSLVIAVAGAAPVTLARFTAADEVAAAFETGELAPPTGLTAATSGTSVVLSWSPSSSARASGYEVLRSAVAGSDYTVVRVVTPVGATTTTDSPGTGTWFYVLRTTFHNWTSVRSNEASVVLQAAEVTTPTVSCDPALNRPVTVSAGDNDGYEGTPGLGCIPDSQLATDRNSGTSTTNSCLSNAKDRHVYWGYAFDLPPTVTSITGITISARAGQSNNGGTTWLCMELSSDGGATWTVPRRVDMAGNAVSTYTFGGPLQAWDRTWTLADLGAGFRVRVTDSSSQPAKDFRLDGLGVAVSYVP